MSQFLKAELVKNQQDLPLNEVKHEWNKAGVSPELRLRKTRGALKLGTPKFQKWLSAGIGGGSG